MPQKVIELNEAVSMYEQPVFGTVRAETRVMALSVDKESKNPYRGLAREITKSNQNNPDMPGNIDESKLIIVESKNFLSWKKVRDLKIEGIEGIIEKISGNDKYFIGLEDPDIWTDEQGFEHIYFTIAFKYKALKGFEVYLGHAQGSSLESLAATAPVLSPTKDSRGFKEVAISPEVYGGSRINLAEAQFVNKTGEDFSRIAVVEAKNMGKPWDFKSFIHLDKIQYPWCIGETSPCTFLPRDFASLKNSPLLMGIINGREHKKVVDGQKIYGKFRPGLILFNPKTGEIPWIAKEPLFEDPDARTITFASEFVQISKDEGILYCHVDDSFVRAYKINAKELKRHITSDFQLHREN